MACGINRDCIEKKLRSAIDGYGGDFDKIEEKMAAATNRPSDKKMDAKDIDEFVRQSGATDGHGFVHNRVVSGILSAIDKNGDNTISAQEWAQRKK